MQISHESIYRSLYVQSRGELRRQLTSLLRTRRRRAASGRVASRGQLIEMVPIAQRPPEVDDRRVPRHCEGDLLLGARFSLGDRDVRRAPHPVCAARPLARSHHPPCHRRCYADRIHHLPAHLLKSLTWDQGRELAAHSPFTDHTGIPVYFCDPHSPWQRGTNENTNALLRQYLPKGIYLFIHNQDSLYNRRGANVPPADARLTTPLRDRLLHDQAPPQPLTAPISSTPLPRLAPHTLTTHNTSRGTPERRSIRPARGLAEIDWGVFAARAARAPDR